MNKSQKLFMAIGSIAVVATAVIGGALLFNGGSSSDSSTSTSSQVVSGTSDTSSSDSTTTTETNSTSSEYKDGTYTASTSYTAPQNHTNKIDVSLTIASGKVSAVTVTGTANDDESEQYIDGFENGIESAIIGKDVSSLSVSRVSGASLTSRAFNNVLDTIRSDAAA